MDKQGLHFIHSDFLNKIYVNGIGTMIILGKIDEEKWIFYDGLENS